MAFYDVAFTLGVREGKSSRPDVHRFIRRENLRSRRSFSLAMEDRSWANEQLRNWLRQLHRQIEPKLARLAEVGLISKADQAGLAKSSVQMEERCRSEVESWISRW